MCDRNDPGFMIEGWLSHALAVVNGYGDYRPACLTLCSLANIGGGTSTAPAMAPCVTTRGPD